MSPGLVCQWLYLHVHPPWAIYSQQCGHNILCPPQGLTSYQAYTRFPSQVSRLQQLEPRISGGTTCVLAVSCAGSLHVANVGDSRAVLVYERSDGTLATEQLSVDHTVDNQAELSRLELLGLSRSTLVGSGRLGTHECTRSIGDYSIKGGYKDVDILR